MRKCYLIVVVMFHASRFFVGVKGGRRIGLAASRPEKRPDHRTNHNYTFV